MKLSHQQYGKARVRVLRVLRSGKKQDIVEVAAEVTLRGDFESSYTDGDNSKVVPTDTMKNTVNALAREHLTAEIEKFGLKLGEHFLGQYRQVETVTVRLSERPWQRMSVDGKPHAHSFIGHAQERPFALVTSTRESQVVESGIEDLLILKSTGSGFVGYPKDNYTTLPETKDRIFATSMNASWKYRRTPKSYTKTNQNVLKAMLKIFAVKYSPSVQTTLFEMATAALQKSPEISEITLKLPNKHYLLINLAPFGLENKNEVFVPTDEPHGQIEATVKRD